MSDEKFIFDVSIQMRVTKLSVPISIAHCALMYSRDGNITMTISEMVVEKF